MPMEKKGTTLMQIVEKKNGLGDLNQLIDLKGATKWHALNAWVLSHNMKIKIFRHASETSGDCSLEMFNGRKFDVKLYSTDAL